MTYMYEGEGMKAAPIASLLVLLLSAVALAPVRAVLLPVLPATEVQLTVVDGVSSYWNSTLSGVPPGFDVRNGTYLGWCTDRSVDMLRSVPHNVMLYSSLAPPSAVSGVNWIAVNYVLNHQQGSMMDVQQALWHLTGWWDFANLTPAAQAMVSEADAHPGYDPLTGAVLAVICLPSPFDFAAQASIICLRAVTVGGYTISINGQNVAPQVAHYGMLVAILVGAFTIVRRKTAPQK